jgi:hypothetical protein
MIRHKLLSYTVEPTTNNYQTNNSIASIPTANAFMKKALRCYSQGFLFEPKGFDL